MHPEFANFLSLGTKEAKGAREKDVRTIFKTYSLGVSTNRDSVVYDFKRDNLSRKIDQFIEDYNAEVSRWARSGRPKLVDDFVQYDKVKWSNHLKEELKRERYGKYDEASIRLSLYRPFSKRLLYYSKLLNDAYGLYDTFFPTAISEAENIVLCVAGVGDRKGFGCLITNAIPNLDLAFEKAQCFPFYTYNEDGSGRRENITEWALGQFRAQYGPEVGKWDIFHYVYALLHHPQYRQRYAENLKRELPRIPLVADGEAFARLVSAGERLKALHLGYEQAQSYPLRAIENPKASADELYRVTKMRLSPDKTALVVNEALTLAGIPAEVYQYRLGNRSALEWVIDQYQVSTDPRSGITSDPNREDEPEYIAQLARRVVTVSLATVEIVNGLPALPEEEDPAPHAGD